MSINTFRVVGGLCALAVLAGCEATMQQAEVVEPGPYEGPGEQATVTAFDDLTNIVWDVPAEEALSTQQGLIAALEGFGVPRTQNESLMAWIARIEGSGRPELAGLGGGPAQDFLELARESVSDATGAYAGAPPFTIKGKILDYEFDDGTKSGRLVVQMNTNRVLNNGTLQNTVAHLWSLRIGEGGFSVYPKDLSNPENVFPQTPLRISAPMAEGFNYKLFAQGGDIVIESVQQKVGNSSWVTLPPSHPLYTVLPESCVDMMFPDYPPPVLQPDAAPPGYCLGRCSTPPLVNTR